ncbi:MAG: LysM peptidoglycan-binding domain-containing protein [Phycisphaerales bacterium]|nr:LysM peptidoglycan-binding domain-containing protein [Phycisphaerales bacterium]
MRKDVRFGLAIGGVLLAVIVVYTLTMRSKPVQTAGEPTPAIEQTTSSQTPPAPADTTHEQQPNAGTEVASAQGADPFATTVTPGNPPPAVSTTPNDPRSVTDWNQLLATGQQPPTVTSTPPSHDPTPTNSSTELTQSSTAGTGSTVAAANTPASTDAPSTQPVGARTYKVQKGDTLSSIAKATYGSANYYPHILRANPGLDPHKLRPGMVINLPDPHQVVPNGSTQASDESSAGGSTNTPALDTSRQYRVQEGDSLYKISVKLYGNGKYVDKIYEKNKNLIGSDPARLKVGSVLELPEAPTVAQAR